MRHRLGIVSLVLIALGMMLVQTSSAQTRVDPQLSPAVAPQAPQQPPVSQPPLNQAPVLASASAPAPLTPVSIKLGPGDLLEIGVFGVPDYKQEVRVSGSGEVNLALIGSVRLAGFAAEDSQKIIEKKLVEGGFFRDPHVTIFVKEYATQGISVMGEVAKPGVLQILGVRHLYDVIAAAGGLTPRAGTVVTITRQNRPQEPLLVKLSADPEKSAESNVEVFPGDTVVVSKAGVVYVVGDVGRAGGFVMENGGRMTVLQAIALAAGVNRTAALNAAKLIRKTPTGMEQTPLPLKEILAAKHEDQSLQADDIIFVPGSAARAFAKRGLDAIVQVATGMAIYAR